MNDCCITTENLKHFAEVISRYFAPQCHNHDTATGCVDGMMSASDKAKLDAYPASPVEIENKKGLKLSDRSVDYIFDDQQRLKHIIEHARKGTLDYPCDCAIDCNVSPQEANHQNQNETTDAQAYANQQPLDRYGFSKLSVADMGFAFASMEFEIG